MAKNEYKKNGENINLKGIIIHQVKKEAGIRSASIKFASNLLKVDIKERLFIGKIYKAYFDSSKPIYGIFENEDTTFKDKLNTYIKNKDLIVFSKEATNHYKKKIISSAPATGGFMIFAHFENTDKHFDYMLVMTITNKDGFVVSDNLSLQDIKNLDLSKVDVACMINLTKWQNIESGVDTESKTYLSFAKGNKDVSVYFMSFIDCDNKTTKTESTNRFIIAFESYCNEKGYERVDKIRLRNMIYNHCTECIDLNKEILLSSISAILDPANINDFEIFAADDRFGVSSVINGDKSKFKPMKYVSYKGVDMTIEFDAGLINDGSVVYNKEKKQLTFKKIPDKLASQIPN